MLKNGSLYIVYIEKEYIIVEEGESQMYDFDDNDIRETEKHIQCILILAVMSDQKIKGMTRINTFQKRK